MSWKCIKYGLTVSDRITGQRMCAKRWVNRLTPSSVSYWAKCCDCSIGEFYYNMHQEFLETNLM